MRFFFLTSLGSRSFPGRTVLHGVSYSYITHLHSISQCLCSAKNKLLSVWDLISEKHHRLHLSARLQINVNIRLQCSFHKLSLVEASHRSRLFSDY